MQPVATEPMLREVDVLRERVKTLEAQAEHEKKLSRIRRRAREAKRDTSKRIGLSMSLAEAKELDAYLTVCRRVYAHQPGVLANEVHKRLYKYILQRTKTAEMGSVVKP